jgi:transcriptional regulator with XRE-family HTH domain
MNGFEHTLLGILAEHGMSLSELAKETGYNPIYFEDVVSGKSRKIPVDFFVRLAEILELSNQEKDELLRSWVFGVERWS